MYCTSRRHLKFTSSLIIGARHFCLDGFCRLRPQCGHSLLCLLYEVCSWQSPVLLPDGNQLLLIPFEIKALASPRWHKKLELFTDNAPHSLARKIELLGFLLSTAI